MIFWEKKEGVERERDVLGGDERRMGRENSRILPYPTQYISARGISSYIGRRVKLYRSVLRPI